MLNGNQAGGGVAVGAASLPGEASSPALAAPPPAGRAQTCIRQGSTVFGLHATNHDSAPSSCHARAMHFLKPKVKAASRDAPR
jgi:hypothetical protein